MYNQISRLIPFGILLLAVAYFGMLSAPDITWINTDSDSGIYLWSTQHLGLSHPTGAPLYNLFGHLVTKPFDTIRESAQALSLLSAVCSAITCYILYLETKKFLAPLIFAAAGVVVSQSTIIETYAATTLCMVLMYYWRDKKWLFLIPAILAIGIHHLAGLALIPLLIYRRTWTDLFILVGALWYIYYPFAVRPDAGWSEQPWLKYFAGQNFLIGGIDPQVSLPTRLYEFLTVMVGGLGIATIFLFRITRLPKLIWFLIGLPLLYYVTDLPPQTYVYTMPSFAFLGIALSKVIENKHEVIVVTISCLLMVGFNIYYFDIGNRLDPEPTSARIFLEDLKRLPEGSIVYAKHRGWEKVASWNVDKDIQIYTNERTLGNKIPTHRTVLIDSSRYLVDIIPCNYPFCPSHTHWSDRTHRMGSTIGNE